MRICARHRCNVCMSKRVHAGQVRPGPVQSWPVSPSLVSSSLLFARCKLTGCSQQLVGSESGQSVSQSVPIQLSSSSSSTRLASPPPPVVVLFANLVRPQARKEQHRAQHTSEVKNKRSTAKAAADRQKQSAFCCRVPLQSRVGILSSQAKATARARGKPLAGCRLLLGGRCCR